MPIEVQTRTRICSTRESISTAIIYNHEHDVESFYWLLLWTLIDRVEHVPSQIVVKEFYSNRSECPPLRAVAGYSPVTLRRKLKSSLHSSLTGVEQEMSDVWKILCTAYNEREDNLSDVTTYSRLYDPVRQLLGNCLQASRDSRSPIKIKTFHVPKHGE
jgi:hypothetical protein